MQPSVLVAVLAAIGMLWTGFGSFATELAGHRHARDAYETALVALGRKLFFDARLSMDGAVSCATCHQPSRAFTDGLALARGVAGRQGTRNTPSLIGAGREAALLWDGRRSALEAQVLRPFYTASEHGLSDEAELLSRVAADGGYRELVRSAFGARPATAADLARALAAFVRSLAFTGSAFDRYYFGSETGALDHAAKRGFEIFRGRGRCVTCHVIGPRDATFTDGAFHPGRVPLQRLSLPLAEVTTRVANTLVQDLESAITGDPDVAALGRFVVSLNPLDIGKFRTPSLRNVALTAPYMHDGSVATLEEAVEHEVYYRALNDTRSLGLSPIDKADLVAFLRALTDASLGGTQ